MGIILEILFGLFVEIILQLVIEVLIFFGFESLSSSFKDRKSTNKYLALAGCFLLGGIIGFISFLVYPERIFNNKSLYAISLIISPILIGLVLGKWGKMRINSGKRVSALATFWGGALFAFAYSLTRFLLIQ